MSEVTIASRVRSAIKLSSTWTSQNPVLKLGEIGISVDNLSYPTVVMMKVGNGTTAWNYLPFVVDYLSTKNGFNENTWNSTYSYWYARVFFQQSQRSYWVGTGYGGTPWTQAHNLEFVLPPCSSGANTARTICMASFTPQNYTGLYINCYSGNAVVWRNGDPPDSSLWDSESVLTMRFVDNGHYWEAEWWMTNPT